MRFATCFPNLAGSLSAGAAQAQLIPLTMTPNPPANSAYSVPGDGPTFRSPRERYLAQLADLRARSQRMTASDGGALTEQHRERLQKELDRLNRRFGMKPVDG